MKLYYSLLVKDRIKEILVWVLFLYLVVANLTTQ
jgi:hypothetical protein